MIYKIIFAGYFVFFIGVRLMGQNDCTPENEKINFATIFGKDRLSAFGPDTLVTKDNRNIIYCCELCKLTRGDKNGKPKWTIDLEKFKCNLIAFNFIHSGNGGKIKGCDIILQFKDKSIYILNSRTGKFKSLRKKDIRYANSY